MSILCYEKMRKLLYVFKSTPIFLLFIINVVVSTPPADPIKCLSKNTNCTITNANGIFPDRSICHASEVKYPTSEEELIAMVALATKNKIKMKVATRYSHSIPKLVCPGGQKGLLISTNKLNKMKIDKEAKTMVVESGVTLREIISEAGKFGLALPYTPYWWGITIGGLLATGAHGSSLWGKGSAVHEYVVELRIVSPSNPQDGYVKVRTLDESDQDHFNAAKVSLGVLGVISQVTLKLEYIFKRSITYSSKSDSDLGDEIIHFGRKHEFGDVTWYPSQRKAVYRIDDRVPMTENGNGLYHSIPFRPTLSAELAIVRTTEEIQEAKRDGKGKCCGAKLITATLATFGYGLTNNGLFFGYPIVGLNHRMQSSGTCLDSLHDGLITACPWDSRIKGQFYHQTAFSIPLSVVKNFIEDVQKLVDLEPNSLCGLELNNGILMRYVTASSAYLGKTEDAVDFDITYYRSKDPLKPRLFEDILEEIEQIGLFKYNGLPHWGKNRNLGFVGAIKKYPNAEKFLKVKAEYDSEGLFSSEWTDQVLGLKEGVTILKDGCALEGLCICSKDSHCAPNHGYYCKPGRIYKDARVCAPHDVKETEGQSVVKDEL